MKYACLIHYDESDPQVNPDMAGEAGQALMQAYFKFGEEGEAAGVLAGGEALMPSAMATSVRVRDGETITTDGPFAETKEQLGGFYLLECDNLDEAISWAARIPHAADGTIEVRPVVDFNQ